MKKFLALMLVAVMLLTVAAAEVKLGQVEFAAHGTRSFAVLTVAVDGETIVAASIDEFQVMTGAENVPNSDTMFADLAADGKGLASKRVNNGSYSTTMNKNAGATLPLAASYDAIEAFVTGKTIAELEAEIEGKTSEEMVDAVSSCTLVDTLGYVTGLLEAAKAAGAQTGYYTLYNKTGEKVTKVTITENVAGTSKVVAEELEADAVQVVTYTVPASTDGHGALTISFETESGYVGTFATLSIETAPITMLAADALTGPTQISFFAPAAE